jgi:hypothetical protein
MKHVGDGLILREYGLSKWHSFLFFQNASGRLLISLLLKAH